MLTIAELRIPLKRRDAEYGGHQGVPYGFLWLRWSIVRPLLAILFVVYVASGHAGGPVAATQAAKADADLVREGALALAAAHGERPRYGGTFLSAGNEEIPFYDMHQTSFGGVYAATAPAYNCLVRTSPYDPLALEVVPELARSREIGEDGDTITFHLHPGVKWHDGVPFSSADVKYTTERIMHPPPGMVSVRGPIFTALIAQVETPDADTVIVHGKGPSSLVLSLFANGWNVIIPKHIVEKDPVNALKTQVIGTGPFRLREPPTTSLWRYERNPDYFIKGLPSLDALEIHIITDPQALAAAVLSQRVYWNDAFSHPNLDGDLASSLAKQHPRLIHAATPSLAIAYLSMHSHKAPFDDVRVRQAISEAMRRDAIGELGKETGVVGTANYPKGLWAMPKEMQQPLIGYGPDMTKRLAHAKELLASHEKEKGKIDWSKIKLQCSSNIPVTCANAQIIGAHITDLMALATLATRNETTTVMTTVGI
jgi:peptide/nickel transport system substrate-binding protein